LALQKNKNVLESRTRFAVENLPNFFWQPHVDAFECGIANGKH